MGWGGLGGWSAKKPGAWCGGGGAGIGDSLPEAVVPLLSSPSARWDSLGKGKGGGEQRCPSDSGRRGGQTDRLIDQQCSPRVHPPLPPDSHTLLVVTGAQRREARCGPEAVGRRGAGRLQREGGAAPSGSGETPLPVPQPPLPKDQPLTREPRPNWTTGSTL